MSFPTADAPDRYRRLAARFTNIADAVPAALWTRPSPCADWTALDVVSHVATTQLDLLGRMAFSPDGLVGSVDMSDPLATWRTVQDLVQTALDSPAQARCSYNGYFGPTTFAETISSFYNADLVVHGWDVAQATGLTEHTAIEPAEMVRIRSDFEAYTEMIRMPGIFGPEHEVGPDATEQDRFLAWAGRRSM